MNLAAEMFGKIPSFASVSSRSQMFFKICHLKYFANFAQKYLCRSLFIIKLQALGLVLQLDYKETPTWEFFCDICEIFKNTVSYRTPSMGASTADLQTRCSQRLHESYSKTSVTVSLL